MLQQQKKMFKVLCPIEKKGGGTFWTRCGTAYENRDESINCYLDFFPKDFKFQIRALDEEDLRRMNERKESKGITTSDRSVANMPPMSSHASAGGDDLPF